MAFVHRFRKHVILMHGALALSALVSTARAGTIFDDDYVPPAHQPAPEITAQPAASETSPATPANPAARSDPKPATDTSPANPDAAPKPPVTIEKVEQKLLDVPPAQMQAQSRKLFKAAFADELKDRTINGRAELAAKLLAESDKLADSPSDRFVLLVGACEAATEGGDLNVAMRAADTAAASYRVDSASLCASAILKTPIKPASPAQATEVANAELDVESRLAKAGDYETAGKIIQSLRPLAARSTAVNATLMQRIKELAEWHIVSDRAADAAEVLKKTPGDASANSDIGQFLCFAKGDLDQGLAALALGNDEALRSAASRDLASPSDSAAQIAAGDEWWKLTEQKSTRDVFKPAMRSRAQFWYAKALAGGSVSGLRRALLEKRVAQTPDGHGVVFVSALKETNFAGAVADSRWGLGKDQMGPDWKDAIEVGGVGYAHGLSFNPGDNCTVGIGYSLDGKYSKFTGGVGIGGNGMNATVIFKILADGKEVWRSKPMRKNGLIEQFSVNVAGAKSMELQAQLSGSQQEAHCAWLEPQLETAAAP